MDNIENAAPRDIGGRASKVNYTMVFFEDVKGRRVVRGRKGFGETGLLVTTSLCRTTSLHGEDKDFGDLLYRLE